jgi:putative SOS response-associated peptidase YedK
MCGRFTLYSSGDEIARAFAVGVTELVPRYNIAPTQSVAVVRARAGGRELAWLRWGLVPSWAKDAKIAPINAKAETAAERPFFRVALRQRRCLVPADGWYEWQGQGKHKQPYFFAPTDGKPLAFAGLWETWGRAGEALATCAILTTAANELTAPVHDRMPVILPAEAYTAWLDPANQTLARCGGGCAPSYPRRWWRAQSGRGSTTRGSTALLVWGPSRHGLPSSSAPTAPPRGRPRKALPGDATTKAPETSEPAEEQTPAPPGRPKEGKGKKGK